MSNNVISGIALFMAFVLLSGCEANAAARRVKFADNLLILGSRNKPAAPTKVWIEKSAKALKVFVRAEEPATGKMVAKATKKDQRVWRDDSVTVFLDLARNMERIHFISVNSKGVVGDGWLDASVYGDLAFDSRAKVTVKKGRDYWSAEFSIPYKNLGAVPAAGDMIGLDVMRRRTGPAKEEAAVCASKLGSKMLKSNYPEPAGYKSFYVGNPSAEPVILSSSRGALDPDRPNANWFRAVANNRGNKPLNIVVNITTRRGKKLAQRRFIAPPKTKTPLNTFYGADFKVSDEIIFKVAVDGAGKHVYYSRYAVAKPIGRRVYEKTSSFDKNLLVQGRKIPESFAAMTWPQGAGVWRMHAFASRHGFEWSQDAFWKELAGEVTLPIQTTPRPHVGGQYSDISKNASYLRKHKLKVMLIPSPWEADGGRKYWQGLGCYGGFKADPGLREKYLMLLRSALKDYGDIVYGICVNDELHYSIIKNGVKLFEKKQKKYPHILKINEDVKKRFGFGKYGIPHSLEDKNRWRWIAWKRWVVDYVDKFDREVSALARKLKPGIIIVSVDPQGEVQPFDITRWRDGRYDIVTWQTGASPYPRQTRPSLIPKFVSDLARPGELWPCIHAESLFCSYTPNELRTMLSHALVGGATGLHFFPLEQRGDLGNLERYGSPARWAYWVKAAKYFSEGWRVKKPEGRPDAALFFSNDSHMALPAAWCWSGLVSPAYAYMALELKSSFEFIDEGGIERGYFNPGKYKLIIVPYADVVRGGIAERFIEAVRSGTTLVITDPKAFRFDLDGSESEAARKLLLGGIRIEKTTEHRKRARAEQVAFLAKSKIDFDVIQPGLWELLGSTYFVMPGKGDTVLIRYGNGKPAAVMRKMGKGRVIWIGFNIYRSNFDKPPMLKEFSISSKDFFRALFKDCGVRMNLPHYDANLPPADPYVVRLPGVCITNNSVTWLRNRPLAIANADVGVRYTYDVFPDGVGEKIKTGWIPVGKGCLTDRGRIWREKKRSAGYIAKWRTTKSFGVTFDLSASRELAEANIFVTGQVGSVSLFAGDSQKTLAPAGEVKVGGKIVGVKKITYKLAGRKARYVKFVVGKRPEGTDVTLVEVDIWQK